MVKLADPAVRADCSTSGRTAKEAGVFRGLARWGTYVIGDTYAAANEGCAFRTVADIAAERGTAPFDTLLDIVLADDLRTVLWPNTDDGDEATWAMRAEIWSDPRAMVGGSDAGAHLDRMCGSNYPTAFLGDCLRGRKLVPVEQAVHMMTGQPAAALRPARPRPAGRGLRGRRLRLRSRPPWAPSRPAWSTTCPATPPASIAGSHGVVRVLVNGVETVRDGRRPAPSRARLLRSGQRHGIGDSRPRPETQPRRLRPAV